MNDVIRPMLAAPMSKAQVTDWTDWAIEEKFDGHRMIVSVSREAGEPVVRAYARPRGDGRMLERQLAPRMREDLAKLPSGVYDGELLAGDTATDVTRLDLESQREIVLFDLLELQGTGIRGFDYDTRRQRLADCVQAAGLRRGSPVKLAAAKRLKTKEDVEAFVKAIWDRGGEGAILKRRGSPYLPDKRKADMWVKIKRVESAALTVVGFKPSRGTVRFPGHPFAIVKLRDDDGNETSCKTKDDHELNQFMLQWSLKTKSGLPWKAGDPHPALGRKLRVEFQRRTRTGGYQGPVRWDRWEDE